MVAYTSNTMCFVSDKLSQYRPLEALKVADQAYADTPTQWPIIKRRVDCLKVLRRFNDAENVLSVAQKHFTKQPSYHVCYAQLKLAQNDYTAAADALERARGAGLDNGRYYASRVTSPAPAVIFTASLPTSKRSWI
jgi:predicted Zn-dependent protease